MAPTNTTSTAVQPTFEIITSLPIDTSSVHWNLTPIDSTHIYPPTICVIPYYIDTAATDSLWPYQAIEGTGTVVNDTTIEFTTGTLPNSNEFVAIVMGLRLIQGGDTIMVPDTVARLTFTTISLPVRLVTFSLISSGFSVREHDTISVQFSQKLDSTSTPVGPILSLSIPTISVDTVNDSIEESDSTIGEEAWLDPNDSTILHLLPAVAYQPGATYRISEHLSGLTGDTTQDFADDLFCRKSYRLNIVAAPTAGLQCMPTIHFDPTINENYKLQYDSSFDSSTMTEMYDTAVVFDSSILGTLVNAGDTVVYTAPTQVSGAIFKQWTGSGNIAIDTSTNPVLMVTETADQLRDLNVVALYEAVPVDTVCVSTSGANSVAVNSDFVEVRTDSQDCPNPTLLDTCASTSAVNYFVERGKTMMLRAYCTADSISFDHWYSTDTTINGVTSPFVSFVTNGPKCVTAVFRNAPCPQYNLCSEIWGVWDPNPLQIAYITDNPNVNPVCIRDEEFCPPHTSTLQINKCSSHGASYGLWGYSLNDNGCCHTQNSLVILEDPSGNPKDLWANGGNGQYSVPTYIDNTFVTFYLRKLRRTLTIVIKTDDGELPDGTDLTFSTNVAQFRNMWISDNVEPISEAIAQSTDGSFIYTLTYYACTPITLNAGTNGCYNFVQWDETNPPNTDPSDPNAATNPNLSFTMDQDRQVTANFQVPFRLLSVTMWQWPRLSGYTDLDPDDPGGGDPAASGPVQKTFRVEDLFALGSTTSVRIPGLWASSSSTWPQSQEPSIILNFNKPVNSGVPLLTEQTASFARQGSSSLSYNPTTTATNKSLTVDLTEMQWITIDHHYHPWKGQNLSLFLRTGPTPTDVPPAITSADGQSLCVEQTLLFSTENPDIEWDLTNTNIGLSHDNCFLIDCDACSWTYWMAQLNGGWTAGSTCLAGATDDGGAGFDDNANYAANTWDRTSDPDGDGDGGQGDADDYTCVGSGTQTMISYPHALNSITLSAGAVSRLVSVGDYGLAWWTLLYQVDPDITASAADPSKHSQLNASNYSSIASNALSPFTIPDCTALSQQASESYIQSICDYPQATGPQLDWWGGGSSYGNKYWVNPGNWNSSITVSVAVK